MNLNRRIARLDLDLVTLGYAGLFLACAILAHAPDQYRSGWQWIAFSLTVVFAGYLTQVIGIIAASFFGWLTFSGIRVFLQPVSDWGSLAVKADASTAISTCILLIFILFFSSIKTGRMMQVRLGVAYVSLVNCCIMLWHYHTTWQANGLLDNYAMDGTFIALCYPLLLALYKANIDDSFKNICKSILVRILPIGAILASNATTPVLMLIAIFGVMFFKRANKYEKVLMTWMAVTVAGCLWFRLGSMASVTTDSGRYAAWRMWWDWYQANVNPWIGSGLGTFEVLGPEIQHATGQANGFMMWAHNEYLQLYFETGAIGLIWGVALLARITYLSRKTEWKLATIAALSVGLITQPIARHYLPILFIMSFIVVILREENHVRANS